MVDGTLVRSVGGVKSTFFLRETSIKDDTICQKQNKDFFLD